MNARAMSDALKQQLREQALAAPVECYLKRAPRRPVSIAIVLAFALTSLVTASWTSAGNNFRSVGSMSVRRAEASATLLPNGQVLVTGGGMFNNTTGELFDPAAGSFAATGSMTTSRGSHTATLLQNGTVLVVGGGGSGGLALASAEIYDPVSGAFTPTGNMATTRSHHTATLLADGRVLIVGGHRFNAVNSVQSSAEIYDPGSGTFTPTGGLAVARQDHTATFLQNSEVLITGGYGATSLGLGSAELYDPTAGDFSLVGSLSDARGDHTATPLLDGRVLVVGGFDAHPGGGLGSTELYDPGGETFSLSGSLLATRGDHTATILPGGTVIITGGFSAFPFTGTTRSNAEIYDPTSGVIVGSIGLNTARGRHAAAALDNGEVLVAGGLNVCCSSLQSAEVYVLRSDFFTLTPCRVIDTRTFGPLGGPALVAGEDRTFSVADTCGIPSTAKAVSVNIAVTGPTAAGNLRLHPGGTPVPPTSSINYSTGQTRSNNAVVPLNNMGELAVFVGGASGNVHFILDVNGYFQ